MTSGDILSRRRTSASQKTLHAHSGPPISTSPVHTPLKPQSSISSNITTNLQALFELSFLITTYILQPWTFLEIFLLPTLVAMGFFTTSNPFNPKTSIPALADKVILVTGGNTGLGKETILQLARHGPAKIYLGARSAAKATAAINSINNQLTTPTEIEHLPLDLNDLNSVTTAANLVLAKSSRLDILILNAGIMATPPARTAQGFDSQMGVNHVGHFHLTTLLLPLLRRTATTATTPNPDVRVISLTSEAHNLGPASLDTIFSTARLTATSPWSRYGASKAANIMFAAELARRAPELTTASVHPGIILTDLHTPGQQSYSVVGWGMKLLAPLIAQDVAHGAYNSLWAATAEKEKMGSGKYWTPVGREKAVKWATQEEAGRRCWEWTEEEIKKAGF